MTRRDDIVAALERAERWCQWANALRPKNTQGGQDAVLLRALADALREGQERGPAQFNPWGGEVSCVWIIPEPRIARRALSNEGE